MKVVKWLPIQEIILKMISSYHVIIDVQKCITFQRNQHIYMLGNKVDEMYEMASEMFIFFCSGH